LELVTAKRYSTPANDALPKNPETGSHRALAAKLADRSYWLIYYRPRAEVLGGDVSVFIDAATNEVIHVYRGR
jgi:hypothetical protein